MKNASASPSVTHTLPMASSTSLMYCEFDSNHELHDACSLALPPVIYTLCVVSSTCYFSIVIWIIFWLWTLFLLWTLFRPWTLYQPWTPWHTHFEKLHHVTWHSFAAAPYMMHALRVASSACSFPIVPWTLFRPWALYWHWTPWSTHFLF